MCQTGRSNQDAHPTRVDSVGTGPPHFVCLHGLVDTLEVWTALTPPLAERGRVIRYDQRGHGASASPPGPYRREDLAHDVVSLLDSLRIERSVLIGHSMGGIVAMTAALLHPERVAGLVLIGTASQCSQKVAAWYERIALAGEEGGTSGLARAIYGEKSRRKVVGDAQGIAHVTRTLKSLAADPLTPKLAEIRCPVLLLVGQRDPMGPRASEIIASEIDGAILQVVARGGHWLHVDAPEVVMDALLAWLRCNPGLES